MSKDSGSVDLITEPLGKHHDRAAFSSGADDLDHYLRKQANQDARRHIAAPFVIRASGTYQVIGYYTLSSASVIMDELPEETTRRLPRYPSVPAVLIGRLAIDSQHHGQGLGKRLLIDALRRCWEQNAQVAAALVLVDARDATAAQFYKHFGFQGLPDHTGRLFLPMQTIASLFR